MRIGIIAERAKQLQLAALSIARGMQSGNFRSCFSGQGIEFDSLREYEQGDDIRSIDWNLMARSGKAFAKIYREERDIQLFLLIDMSRSMDIGYGTITPLEKALEAAALITFAGEQLGSSTGALFFDGKITQIIQPQRGKHASLKLLHTAEQNAASPYKDRGTALVPALAATARLLKRRTFIFLISDFKVAGYEKELKLLAYQHDVAAVCLTTTHDEKLPPVGVLCFQDPETGIERLLPTDSRIFQHERSRDAHEVIQQWKNTCLHCNAFPLELACTGNTVHELNHFFSTAGHVSLSTTHSIGTSS